MSKRILVTGGCGFIGHHLIEHFIKNTDWHIITIDRMDYASNGMDRLRDIKAFNDNRVEMFSYDLQTPMHDNFIKELGEIDYIIHMAAGSHVDNSIKEPASFIKNNIDSTIVMLEMARKIKPKKFIYFSTDEVYGTAPEGISYKEGDRFNAGNPYSASKAGAENICQAYANTYKVPIQITNLMNVIGERQHPEKFLPLVINKVRRGEIVQIHGTPDKTQAGKRHYIHARNVADAILFILNNSNEFLDNIDASKGRFNIVGEKEFDNLTFAKTIANAVGKELKYEIVDFHGQRPGHDLRYALDGSKLKNLGWQPPVSIEDSIKKVVDWSLKDENIRWLEI